MAVDFSVKMNEALLKEKAKVKLTVYPEVMHDSWENAFLRAGVGASLTEWRSSGRQELYKALADTRLERAIGVARELVL